MRTSVHLPVELRDQAQQVAPDMAISELIRDAILIALPVWEKAKAKSPYGVPMQAQIRIAQFRADQAEQAAAAAERAAKAAQRQPRRPKPAPGKAPARHPHAGRPSGTKAELIRGLARSADMTQGQSPRK